MTDDLEHQACSELLGAFVLHGVDRAEAQRVERHLARCVWCRQELDELRAVAADLGTVVDPCPATVWDRIAAQLDRPAVPDAAPGVGVGSTGPGRAQQGVAPTRPQLVRRIMRCRRAAGGPGPVIGRYRILAVVGTGTVVVSLGLSLALVRGQVAMLRSEMGHRGPEVAVESALATPGRRTVLLRSSGGAQLVELVIRPDGAGFVVSTSVPELPGDETYQLWAYIADQPISLGLLGQQVRAGDPFSVGPGASTGFGATTVVITVEPAGGVVTPDRSPIATGTVPAG